MSLAKLLFLIAGLLAFCLYVGELAVVSIGALAKTR